MWFVNTKFFWTALQILFLTVFLCELVVEKRTKVSCLYLPTPPSRCTKPILLRPLAFVLRITQVIASINYLFLIDFETTSAFNILFVNNVFSWNSEIALLCGLQFPFLFRTGVAIKLLIAYLIGKFLICNISYAWIGFTGSRVLVQLDSICRITLL